MADQQSAQIIGCPGSPGSPGSPDSPDLTAEALVDRHAALIRSAIARVAGARADAVRDDVIQCVTIAVWKRGRSGRAIEHVASYLYRCVTRQTVRELGRWSDAATEPLDDAVRDSGPDPGHQLRCRQLGDDVARCLIELHPERALAVGGHLAGLSVHEIMALHGWPYHKARNLVARGLADLRERLRDR